MKINIKILIIFLFLSCNNTKIIKVTADNSQDLKGIRFFKPKTLVLISTQKKVILAKEEKIPLLDSQNLPIRNEIGEQIFKIEQTFKQLNELEKIATIVQVPGEEYSIEGTIPKEIQISDGWKQEFLPLSIEDRAKLQPKVDHLINNTDYSNGIYELIINQDNSLKLKKIK